MTKRETIDAADKLIRDCPIELTLEIAGELAPLREAKELGDYPQDKYANDSYRSLEREWSGHTGLPALAAGQGAKFDALLPTLAAQGVAGSAERIEALRQAYEWRELLGDETSPFTLTNEQIASFSAEYFARNARYSGGESIELGNQDDNSEGA